MATIVKSSYKNWNKDILPEVLKQQAIHKHEQIPGTLRGLLYIFESMGLLYKKDYGSLSKHLVRWREDEDIEGDWIVDNTRNIIDIIDYEQEGQCILKVFDSNIQHLEDFITPYERIRCGIDYLTNIVENFHNHIPRWLGQPKYVESWVEKNAMGSVIYSILEKGDVKTIVAPNGGWSSYTFAKDNLGRLLEKQKVGKEVHVQYYGDSDPSGERMTAEDSKMVKLLTKNDISFERRAITEQTISDFGMERLKIITDPKTLRKLYHKDPNREWFKARHHGQVWQIEVDALQLDMERFKELVLSGPRKHFDERIYEKVVKKIKEKYSADRVHDELKKQLRELADTLGMICY